MDTVKKGVWPRIFSPFPTYLARPERTFFSLSKQKKGVFRFNKNQEEAMTTLWCTSKE
jgi:hypothetical protein